MVLSSHQPINDVDADVFVVLCSPPTIEELFQNILLSSHQPMKARSSDIVLFHQPTIEEWAPATILLSPQRIDELLATDHDNRLFDHPPISE